MELKFYNVGGACCVIQIDGTIKIACDPFLNPVGTEYNFILFKSRRIKAPIYHDSVFNNVGLWLITHGHADHIDQLGVDKMSRDAIVLAEKSAFKFLRGNRFSKVYLLGWNQTKEFDFDGYNVKVRAIPAFHGNNLVMRTLVGKVNGYFLSISHGQDKRTIYFTSDTVYHEKVMNALKSECVDIIIANLGEVRASSFGGPLTMSIEMLKRVINDLHPITVVPIHYEDFSHYSTKKEDLIIEGFRVIEQGNWEEL